MSPVTIGESSSEVTASIVSSSSAKPSSRLPCLSRTRPCWCSAKASRSASPKRSADLRGGHGGVEGGCAVAGRLLPHHHRYEQISALDAIAVLPIDQSLRAREPARATRQLAPDDEENARPERAADGPERRPGLQMRLMRAAPEAGDARRRGRACDADVASNSRSSAARGAARSAASSAACAASHSRLAYASRPSASRSTRGSPAASAGGMGTLYGLAARGGWSSPPPPAPIARAHRDRVPIPSA